MPGGSAGSRLEETADQEVGATARYHGRRVRLPLRPLTLLPAYVHPFASTAGSAGQKGPLPSVEKYRQAEADEAVEEERRDLRP